MSKATDIAEAVKTAIAGYSPVSSGGWTVERTWLPEFTRDKALGGHITVCPIAVEVSRETRDKDLHLYQVDVHVNKIIADMSSVSAIDTLIEFGESLVDFLCNFELSGIPIERVEQVPLWDPAMINGQSCFATTVSLSVRDVR